MFFEKIKIPCMMTHNGFKINPKDSLWGDAQNKFEKVL